MRIKTSVDAHQSPMDARFGGNMVYYVPSGGDYGMKTKKELLLSVGCCAASLLVGYCAAVDSPPDRMDAATLTGDELSKMLSRRKTALTPFQIEDLERRLAGRRLVFTNVQLDGASSYGSGRIQRIFFSIGRRSRPTGCKVSVVLRSPLPKEDSAIGFDEQKRRMATYRIEATVGTNAANRDRFGSPFSPPIYMEDGVIERMDEKGN